MNIGARAAIIGTAIFQKLRRTKRRIGDEKRRKKMKERKTKTRCPSFRPRSRMGQSSFPGSNQVSSKEGGGEMCKDGEETHKVSR